ncbi:hypothetical protein [Paenibacillus phytorum]|uniref:hypothetical protein n=1 Tax=Paenibacillus phytorum TaxID=2654977 RepID=UPI001FE7EEBF|nr:hypothetical protein [Paenibacillus phytorum]
MFGIWERKDIEIVSQHFAFNIALEDMGRAISNLNNYGIDTFDFLKDGTYKPFVFGWMPAVSIYFKDPDGHVVEYISMLSNEPRPDLGVLSVDEWNSINGRNQ